MVYDDTTQVFHLRFLILILSLTFVLGGNSHGFKENSLRSQRPKVSMSCGVLNQVYEVLF